MPEAEPIYRALMLELERQRLALGLTMWQLDEKSGVQDGYYAKALYPDTKSGRQATWPMVQLIASALFPKGFDLIVKARKGPTLDAESFKFKVRMAAAIAPPLGNNTRRHQREFMSQLGKLGAAARKQLPASKRSAIARRAARTRAQRRKDSAASSA